MTPPMTPDEMAALHHLCFTTPPPWTAADFVATLESPFVFLLSEPGGFLIGRAVAGEAELITLAVAPPARRQGAGARLVAAFLIEAQARGAESVFLEVAESNTSAQRLYVAKGFEQKGKRRGYYQSTEGERQDALVMARLF